MVAFKRDAGIPWSYKLFPVDWLRRRWPRLPKTAGYRTTRTSAAKGAVAFTKLLEPTDAPKGWLRRWALTSRTRASRIEAGVEFGTRTRR